jgi:hypothetical protein
MRGDKPRLVRVERVRGLRAAVEELEAPRRRNARLDRSVLRREERPRRTERPSGPACDGTSGPRERAPRADDRAPRRSWPRDEHAPIDYAAPRRRRALPGRAAAGRSDRPPRPPAAPAAPTCRSGRSTTTHRRPSGRLVAKRVPRHACGRAGSPPHGRKRFVPTRAPIAVRRPTSRRDVRPRGPDAAPRGGRNGQPRSERQRDPASAPTVRAKPAPSARARHARHARACGACARNEHRARGTRARTRTERAASRARHGHRAHGAWRAGAHGARSGS